MTSQSKISNIFFGGLFTSCSEEVPSKQNWESEPAVQQLLEEMKKEVWKWSQSKLEKLPVQSWILSLNMNKVSLAHAKSRKNNMLSIHDKYLDDGCVKLSKILRDMLCVQVLKNPAKVNDLKAIGFLIMGRLIIAALKCLYWNFIDRAYFRITHSALLRYSSNVNDIGVDSIPLFELVWKPKEFWKTTYGSWAQEREKHLGCAWMTMRS